MLVTISIQETPSGEFVATAPDFQECTLTDPDADSAFARIRLAVEAALTDVMISGSPVPAVRTLAGWQKEPAFRNARLYEMHMNIRHLDAVARHQKGWPG